MDIIRCEIEAREISSKVTARDTRKYEKPIKGVSMPLGTTKAFVTKSERPKKRIECYFCSKGH